MPPKPSLFKPLPLSLRTPLSLGFCIGAFVITLILSCALATLIAYTTLVIRQNNLGYISFPSGSASGAGSMTSTPSPPSSPLSKDLKENFTSSYLFPPNPLQPPLSSTSQQQAQVVLDAFDSYPFSKIQRESKAFTDINRVLPTTPCEGNGNCRDYVLGYIPEPDPCPGKVSPQFQYWMYPNLQDRPCAAFQSSSSTPNSCSVDDKDTKFYYAWETNYPRCPSDAGPNAGPYLPLDPDTLSIPRI